MKATAAEATSAPQWPQAEPGHRPMARAVSALWIGTVLLSLAGLALTAVCWGVLATSDAIGNIGTSAGAIAYAALGALIVRRTGNLVGWFMLAEGAANAVMVATSSYAIYGLDAHPGSLPAAAVVGAQSETAFVIVATGLAAIFLVFPTGRLPSPRWRPAAAGGLVLTGLTAAAFVVGTRQVALPAPGGITLTYANPLAVRALRPLLSVTRLGDLDGLAVVLLVLLGPAVVSLILRYHRGDQQLRQQLKWLALVIAGVLVCQTVGTVAIAIGQNGKQLQAVPYGITPWLVFLGIPAAMAIAILRRRLFDIDVIISRALLLTLLSAVITAITRLSCSASGRWWEAQCPAAHRGRGRRHRAAVPAAAPAGRCWPTGWSTVSGPRPTRCYLTSPPTWPASWSLGSPGPDGVAAGGRGRGRPGRGVDPGRRELRPIAVWPHGSAPSGVLALTPAGELPPLPAASAATSARLVAVQHGDDLLGALSLAKPPNEPLTSAEDGLLRHLASQAGLVMRNARLTTDLRATIDELRASRRGSSRPRTPNAVSSSGTCTTAPSSS